MSVVYACEGCGKVIDKPRKVGAVIKRDYCEECEPRAEAFADAQEALRKRLYEQFSNDRALLIAASSDGGFKLPDVPDAK